MRRLTADEIKQIIDHTFQGRNTVTIKNDDEINLDAGDKPLCDFCTEDADPNIIYQNTGESLLGSIGGWETWSDDRWGACKMCAEYIDKGDRHGLLNRAARLFLEAHPGLNPARVLIFAGQAHSAFWDTKKPEE